MNILPIFDEIPTIGTMSDWEIQKQVAYYFQHVDQDRFLQKLIDESPDGCILLFIYNPIYLFIYNIH